MRRPDASVDHDAGSEESSFVRGTIAASGYWIRDNGDDTTGLTYLVQVSTLAHSQVDPKGWLPSWVVNLTAKDQALNVLRIKEFLEDQ